MHFSNHKQFFTNEALIASLGFPSVYKDPGDVPEPRCEKCGHKLTDDDPEDSEVCANCITEDDWHNYILLDK